MVGIFIVMGATFLIMLGILLIMGEISKDFVGVYSGDGMEIKTPGAAAQWQ